MLLLSGPGLSCHDHSEKNSWGRRSDEEEEEEAEIFLFFREHCEASKGTRVSKTAAATTADFFFSVRRTTSTKRLWLGDSGREFERAAKGAAGNEVEDQIHGGKCKHGAGNNAEQATPAAGAKLISVSPSSYCCCCCWWWCVDHVSTAVLLITRAMFSRSSIHGSFCVAA